MNDEVEEEVLVLVRATPEKSTKYGHTVCVAGLNQDNEWRRLYPFKFKYQEHSLKFGKRDVIRVVTKIPDQIRERKVGGYGKIL